MEEKRHNSPAETAPNARPYQWQDVFDALGQVEVWMHHVRQALGTYGAGTPLDSGQGTESPTNQSQSLLGLATGGPLQAIGCPVPTGPIGIRPLQVGCPVLPANQPPTSPGTVPVTITMQHIFTALGQVVIWTHYIREALSGFEATKALPLNPARGVDSPTQKSLRDLAAKKAGPTMSLDCKPPTDSIKILPLELDCPE
jgi:hypothetical protein